MDNTDLLPIRRILVLSLFNVWNFRRVLYQSPMLTEYFHTFIWISHFYMSQALMGLISSDKLGLLFPHVSSFHAKLRRNSKKILFLKIIRVLTREAVWSITDGLTARS